MTSKEKISLVETAWRRLDFLNNITWVSYAVRLLDMCLEEEKCHRSHGFADAHTPDTVKATQAAKIMAVKRVAEYLTRATKMPSGRDFLHSQISCFQAAGIVDLYRKDIRRAWRGLDVSLLASLDYCEFVKTREAVSST